MTTWHFILQAAAGFILASWAATALIAVPYILIQRFVAWKRWKKMQRKALERLMEVCK